MKILIADDDCTSRILLEEVLKKNGHEVVVKSNGAEAWQELQNPDAPHLAILDWMMPELSGVEVCRLVRGRPSAITPYIIMLTSKNEKEDIVEGLEAGADDYLSKPFALTELCARVNVGRRVLDLQAAMANKVQELTNWQSQMVRELKVAARLQTKLQATTPLLTAHHEARMLYWPCQHVGGDFFDAFSLPRNRLCIFIGDVAGHGVGPALIASLLKVVVSDVVQAMPDSGPAALCREINNRYREQVPDPDMYATLLLLFHDPQSQRWSGMNCGHPTPIHIDLSGRDKSAVWGSRGSLPIGVDACSAVNPIFSEADELSVPSDEGDALLLFTDGLVDTRYCENTECSGTERLLQAFRETVAQSPSFDYPSALLNRLSAQGFASKNDDVCAVSICVRRSCDLVFDQAFDLTAEGQRQAEFAVSDLVAQRNWPPSVREFVRVLVRRYVASVRDRDHAAEGSRILVQVWQVKDKCRIVFYSQGSQTDKKIRMTDLRSPALENGRSKAALDELFQHVDVFYRGNQNIASFLVARQ